MVLKCALVCVENVTIKFHMIKKRKKSYYKTDFINFIDINECEYYNDTCNSNASCTNSEGSFSCSCLPGYTGDVFQVCTGKYRTIYVRFKRVKSLIMGLISSIL